MSHSKENNNDLKMDEKTRDFKDVDFFFLGTKVNLMMGKDARQIVLEVEAPSLAPEHVQRGPQLHSIPP